MLNKKISKVLFFITLLIIFIGIVSATDFESINNTDTTQRITEKSADTTQTINEVNDNVISNNNQGLKKEINKKEDKTAVTNNEQTYTYIKLNNIKEVSYGDYAYISGYYYYGNDIPLTYTPMTININGQKYTAKTDNKGFFSYNHITDKVFKNTATVSYHGNSKFKAASATKTFNVKITNPIYTYITLNTIQEVNNGQYTTISGHYYYGKDLPLTQTTMKLIINDKTYSAKTDNKGYFTYNYKTNKDGSNTVKVSYPGNTNFKSATATKTFNVKSVGPQYTYIKLNNVEEVAYNGYTTISGHYYYGNNIPLTLTTMRLNINGKQTTTKTDDQGYFTYSYKTERVGKNTVTVSYPGNKNFKAATATKTFNVKITIPIYTYIKLNKINDVEFDGYTQISGYYYYGNDIPLTYTPITLNANGDKFTTKTDNNGYFSAYYAPDKVEKITLTASYPGNKNFKAATGTKTFNVIITSPINTYIYLYDIENVDYGDYTTIDGYYCYGNDVPLTQTTMTININGQKFYTKTDNDGYFRYDYKTNKAGTNTVTVSYPGNKNFQSSSYTKTFEVNDPYYTIEINTNLRSTFKKVGNSNFIAWYQTYTNEYNKGVTLIVLDPDANLDDPSEFLIMDATFYFKNNNNGNIISRSYDFGNGVRTEHDLISGYTPYKVVARYRETTSYEKYLQRNGYWFNPQTMEWYDPNSYTTTGTEYIFDT